MDDKEDLLFNELLLESFDADEVPAWPASIYWYDGGFHTSLPEPQAVIIEVRFRPAYSNEDGDVTIIKGRMVYVFDEKRSNCQAGEWLPSETIDRR